ncbi:F-box only protein 15-like [Amphiura filiformis]|uniref:F-box only protein 15-like n=1 Tax=Amphiura filiformis TaxID=82378 RepID=UPI003B20F40C
MASSRHNNQLKSYLKSHKSGAKSNGDSPVRYGSPKRTSNSPARMSPSSKGQRQVASPGQSAKDIKPRNVPVKSSNAKSLQPKNISRGYYRKPTMESMPEELLMKIFQHMSASELLTAACVCRQWLKLTADNLIWEKLFIQLTSRVKPDEQGQRLGTPLKGPPETKWKRECIHWCRKRRNHKITALLKKISPYTFMPANTEKALQKLCITWQLVLTDINKTEHIFQHSDVFCFPTTTTIRWYSLEPPPVKSLKCLAIFALSPIFFRKDGSADTANACQRSLLLETQLNPSQHAIVECDDLVNLHVINQGLLLATWKDGGEIAFISLCVHNHMLVQRCCLGTSSKEYIPPSLKPKFDDVDTQYGLHHFSCVIELRNQRTVLWSHPFTNLHCEKEDIGDGFVHLIPVRPDVVTDHTFTNKKLTLPWKTDIFKGIVQNLCILDMTLLDEFKSPMWTVSNPVKVLPDEDAPLSYNYDGEPYVIKYEDDKGKVTIQLVTDGDTRYVVTGIMVDVSLATINSWFSTSY